ncbi:MAG: cytochrome-c oxidase, cbb3-type subunit III [Gammaproteobacteria bacterium]|nr:cytochrome-c oxidase, cbb3-type subunit III [Gammaproteobacteria bacterium]MBL7000605.1 cytochrome-c oxidase, cbb3-type subunit III [Gammaproteobacteria bacterium]
MTNFFNWWVIVISLGNIFACYWLIKWTMKKRPQETEVGESTGHAWDGVEELNNPLPKWWLWLFYITIVFALVYLVLFPGLGNYKGVLGWSSASEYNEEVADSKAKYDPIFEAFSKTSVADLAKDAKAVKAGERLFGSYCSQCHGSDAKGTTGYPNLTDNDWLYGGEPDAIKQTIMMGRNGIMPAFAGPLDDKGIENVANYVQSLSGRKVDAASAEAGKATFQAMCVACHGADAKGNKFLGSANLTDTTWLYGGSAGAIKKTIAKGRSGKMPAHKDFLGEDKVHLLAAYIYSLSN